MDIPRHCPWAVTGNGHGHSFLHFGHFGLLDAKTPQQCSHNDEDETHDGNRAKEGYALCENGSLDVEHALTDRGRGGCKVNCCRRFFRLMN